MSGGPVAHVLGFVGSPRRGGNTDVLVGRVLRGAEEGGATTEAVHLASLGVSPCLACEACKGTGQCAQRDDMSSLLDRMPISRLWVLGTPLYGYGPSAQLKAFLDRMYAPYMGGVSYAGWRAVLAIPTQAQDPERARHTVGMLTECLRAFGIDVSCAVLAPGVHARGEVADCTDALERARRAGSQLVASATER